MKERRSTIGSMVGGIAGQVAGTVRRRQQDREPRVLLYDKHGMPSTLPVGAPGRDAIVATAGKLVELADRRWPGGVEGAAEEAAETAAELTETAPPHEDDATGPAA